MIRTQGIILNGIIFLVGMLNKGKCFTIKLFGECHINLGASVTFNIINLLKVDSLYNEGMKPCVYSKRLEEEMGTKWHRGGYDISYRK